jgi:hypothetical protein
MDVWKQKQAQCTALHEAAQRRLTNLRGRKQRLVEAFIFRREIDRETYQEQLDKLNEEMALAEISERDVRIEEMDVQAAVSFGEFVLLNAPRLWIELSLEQEQRLQRVLFLRGVQFVHGAYRVTETNLIFYGLQAEAPRKEDLVALTGIEPVFRP